MSAQYVVLGLGSARSVWVANVAAWATAGAIPVEFSKCLSSAEVAQRLSGLRPHSAVMIERLEDIVLTAARSAGVAVILVSNQPAGTSDIAAVISPTATPGDLLNALAQSASVVTESPVVHLEALEEWEPNLGRLLAVCGSGGTGASTMAIALAQRLADDVLNTGLVVLADLARHGEQGMLHDAQDVVPGVEELVELHRSRRPTVSEIRALTFAVPARGYELLLGMRRPSAWSAMPIHTVAGALEGLRRAYRYTVADVTADFEGEGQSGSGDIEERNGLARTAVLQADTVFVVGQSTLKGVHSCARVIGELATMGVALDRIQPVMNRTPKRFSSHRQIRKALQALVSVDVNPPVHVNEHQVETALHDGTALPTSIGAALAGVAAFASAPVDLVASTGTRVTPGSLGITETAAGQ